MAEIVLLSIIQGVTEFLPISSSAHLILISNFFELNNSNLTMDLSLHLGSLLAVMYHFRSDLKNFIKNKNLFEKIFFTCVPTILFGFLLIKFNYIESLRNYKVIAWSTIFFAILMYFSNLEIEKKNLNKNFSLKSAIIIGLFQSLSLIPGVSRAGITITTARFLNFKRIDSAKIAFLTSLPILVIISFYNFQKIYFQSNMNISILNLIGIIFSFIFSYLTIRFFLIFLKKFNLNIFVAYRLILGLVILLYVYR